MSRLIVLSNRVQLPELGQNKKPSAGGLAVALQNTLAEVGGIWLGWNGEVIEDIEATSFSTLHHNNVDYITTPLNKTQYLQYYCGYANNRLWPALHDRTDLIVAGSDDYTIYQQVNQLFALQLSKIANPDDVIWVHDYHFFSVAHYCRMLGMKNRIGFFLHIPFAALPIWQHLTYGEQLMQHIAYYDVIGLQTKRDKATCLEVLVHYLPNLLITPISSKKAVARTADGHQLQINHYPIGINVSQIQRVARYDVPPSLPFSPIPSHQKTIISVERLDYSKGIPERLQAYYSFLNRNPEYQRQLQLRQIACPSRMDIAAYQALYHNVHQDVEKINQTLATPDWLPVAYSEDTVAHDDLMPLFRYSDICWVNSLKDGMNLVAKEYIAAQDPLNPGVLLLSKYAGAAEQMTAAILVDPLDEQSMMQGLYTALNLSLTERQARFEILADGLYRHNIERWRDEFLADLEKDNYDNEQPADVEWM